MKKLINQRMRERRIELKCRAVRGFGSFPRVRASAWLKKKIEGGVMSVTFPSSCPDWLLFEEAHGLLQLISASQSL